MPSTDAIQRIPLAGTITSRDASLKKDALLFNCYAEQGDGGNLRAVRRFGIAKYQTYTAGQGLGLFNYKEQPLSVIGSTVRLGASVLSTTVDTGSVYQYTPGTSENGFLLKDNLFGYTYDGTTFASIPPASDGVKVQSITITNGGSGYSAPPTVTIANDGGGTGATAVAVVQGGVVTSVTITNGGNGYTSAPTVSFTNAAGDTTGAGAAGYANIGANAYPDQTVPGVAFMDGYAFVMDATGKIWNSALNNLKLWDPLSYISLQIPDVGVAITRHLNYVIGFGSYTTSFFGLNGAFTPPGSPLIINESITAKIGCACATSVVTAENTVFWVGQHPNRGRSVYAFDGLVPVPISDPYIDRILARDPLTQVAAFYIEIAGHKLYYLTLPTSNVTLVFDLTTKMWHVWSALAANATQLSGTIIETDGYTFTVVSPEHGLTNGDIITVTGTGTNPYSENVIVSVIDRNTLTFTTEKIPSMGVNAAVVNEFSVNSGALNYLLDPSVTITTYKQVYYPVNYYAFINNTDLLLGQSNGIIYQISPDFWTDDGTPIYMGIRTSAKDFGSNKRKFYQKAEVIGDKVQAYAYIGYSDNDFQSFGAFRGVNLAAYRSQLRKCAAARRRAWQILYIDQPPMRFYELELEVQEGMQ
jgi:hypothetical protein